MSQDVLNRIYLINATFRLASPLLIASGQSDESDKDVLLFYKDHDNALAYIPGTSFAGVLFNQLNVVNGHLHPTPNPDRQGILDDKGTKAKLCDKLMNYIAGDGEQTQSHLIIEDLMSFDDYDITIRDGNALSRATKVALKGAKYDYQIIEPGISFHFRATIKVRSCAKDFDYNLLLSYIKLLLKDEDRFAVGSNTNNGFGKLKCEKFSVHHFDFVNNAIDADNYLLYLKELNSYSLSKEYYEHLPTKINLLKLSDAYVLHRNEFFAKVKFRFKTNAILGSYQDSDTDKSTLSSRGTPVISGKSLRGPVATKIYEMLMIHEIEFGEEKIKLSKDFLGHDLSKIGTGEYQEYKKSRLKIDEVILENHSTAIYTRNRIDRFTGGTMKHALFDSKPIEANPDAEFEIVFRIDSPYDHEIFLLQNVIKDLYTGWLPIGGETSIGRGVLQGMGGIIRHKNNTIKLGKTIN